jgi:DNA integrity scanning protein DisA with diadenylate cyclase activity
VSALQKFIRHKLEELEAEIPSCLVNAVVEELAHAIDPPVHEGVFPSYGAIIASGPEPLQRRIHETYRGRLFSLPSDNDMRSMSDGIRSFYCRHMTQLPGNGSASQRKTLSMCEKKEVLVTEAFSFENEVALFSLRDEAVHGIPRISPHTPSKKLPNDLMIIQRHKSGEVKLMCSSGIIVIRTHQWTRRIYQYTLKLEELCGEILGSPESPTVDVYRSLARLALHILGAKRIGATIVVDCGALTSDGQSILQTDKSISVKDANLNITRKSHQLLIAHILASNDGAALFSEDGLLLSVRNWLVVDLTGEDVSSIPGGTRQLAAKVASKKMGLPIVTVSADGPVRVFYQGELKKQVL